jgi:hypothetical protein
MTPQKWLTMFAKAVVAKIRESGRATGVSLRPLTKIRAAESWTGGWYADLGRLTSKGAGILEIFYDQFPCTGAMRLSFCYRAATLDRVKQFAHANVRAFGKATPVREVDIREEPFIALKKPLPKRLYRRAILESYDVSNEHWRFFYSVYLPNVIRTTKPQAEKKLVREAATFFADVARNAAGIEMEPDEPYWSLNRAIVRRHLVRERSSKLADAAKIHDDYTCRICGFNFGTAYGELGSTFAEAHHVVPLASPKAKEVTTVDDLITVCSNCHRMLHRMAGETGDISKLRRIVAKHSSGQMRPRKG